MWRAVGSQQGWIFFRGGVTWGKICFVGPAFEIGVVGSANMRSSPVSRTETRGVDLVNSWRLSEPDPLKAAEGGACSKQ